MLIYNTKSLLCKYAKVNSYEIITHLEINIEFDCCHLISEATLTWAEKTIQNVGVEEKYKNKRTIIIKLKYFKLNKRIRRRMRNAYQFTENFDEIGRLYLLVVSSIQAPVSFQIWTILGFQIDFPQKLFLRGFFYFPQPGQALIYCTIDSIRLSNKSNFKIFDVHFEGLLKYQNLNASILLG